MRRILSIALLAVVLVAAFGVVFRQEVAAQQSAGAKQGAAAAAKASDKLILSGDMAIFLGLGKPENCTLKSRYKHNDPVGFRMSAIDPQTGHWIDEKTSEMTVHLSYGGKTRDIKMRWRATAQQPELTFWVAKWIVPDDAPIGIVRYTVTAKDAKGRTGEWKPYDNDQSQLTIVE